MASEQSKQYPPFYWLSSVARRSRAVWSGGFGSEEPLCPLRTCRWSSRQRRLGTTVASSARNDHYFPNTFEQSASGWKLAGATRDLALFNMAVDSKLRGCDLVRLKVADVHAAGAVKERASILQSKTSTPVRFEITDGTRKSLADWIAHPLMSGHEYLWPGRFHDRPHISTRQYARMLNGWGRSIGLEPSAYGTHSMRRTKVAQIYRKTGNLRAVQLLLGHTKMDSTVRYLGVDLEDALSISGSVEI